ncbi:hypothetical protein BDR06DRAFT_955344 [Suillus hirtellus]|nr:hypothetical protein BDR06DRAFT_955344 [Suillus hirtellus]
MQFSLLAIVVVALTAPMFVSACGNAGDTCVTQRDCCPQWDCEFDGPMSMSRSLCDQNSTT